MKHPWFLLFCLTVQLSPAQVSRVIDGDTFAVYSLVAAGSLNTAEHDR